MNRDELEAIRERLEKITPGPWEWNDRQPLTLSGGSRYESSIGDDVIYIEHQLGGYISSCDVELGIHPADAEFIANAPTDVARLLEEVERLS